VDAEPAPLVVLPAWPVLPAPPSLRAGEPPPQWTSSAASEAQHTIPAMGLAEKRMIEIIWMAPFDRNPRAPGPRRSLELGAAAMPRRARGGALALLAACAALGCKREAPAAAPAPPVAAPKTTPPAPAPVGAAPDAPTADTKAALAWIDALRERDPGAVLQKTIVPFDFRDGSRKKKCGARGAATRSAAATITRCLAKDETFHADLSATPELRLVAIDAGTLPPWAQPWGKTLRPGVRAISTFVHGEDEARELVLLVGDDGVRGLWQNVIPEPR
jgi:hypothetical protein